MENFVFDLYGTLVDIKTDEADNKFKTAMQRYFNFADFWERYSLLCAKEETGEEYCEIDLLNVFKKLSPEDPLSAALYFRKKSRERLKVYRGARRLLKVLKKRGKRVYLLTNAQACFTLNELKKLRLLKYFDGIEISSDFGYKKPCKKFFTHAMQKYSLDPSKTVYTGNDLSCDIYGAKAAGLYTAYIKSNLSPEEDELSAARKVADFATEDFKRLYGFLTNL